mmetsp:Transcript_67376/g.132915  ORF Transcript_67376/g.132915 Transcript_67376/m.132915 type:complete len:250 (+) Transcript_67376:1124-1873(+)
MPAYSGGSCKERSHTSASGRIISSRTSGDAPHGLSVIGFSMGGLFFDDTDTRLGCLYGTLGGDTSETFEPFRKATNSSKDKSLRDPNDFKAASIAPFSSFSGGTPKNWATCGLLWSALANSCLLMRRWLLKKGVPSFICSKPCFFPGLTLRVGSCLFFPAEAVVDTIEAPDGDSSPSVDQGTSSSESNGGGAEASGVGMVPPAPVLLVGPSSSPHSTVKACIHSSTERFGAPWRINRAPPRTSIMKSTP